MDEKMKRELVKYGKMILADGWGAGEAVIQGSESRFSEFRKWAYALGVMLRAREILEGS